MDTFSVHGWFCEIVARSQIVRQNDESWQKKRNVLRDFWRQLCSLQTAEFLHIGCVRSAPTNEAPYSQSIHHHMINI